MDPPALPCALLCPVCGGPIEKVGERGGRGLFACKECDCDVIVPITAWEIARLKREQRWHAKRSSLQLPRGTVAPGKSLAAGRGSPEK